MKNSDEMVAALATLLGVLLFIPAVVLMAGFVHQQLWNWFLVPLGAPQLGLAHAVGINCIVGLLKSGVRQSKPEDSSSPLIEAMMLSVILLSIGYIAKQWM